MIDALLRQHRPLVRFLAWQVMQRVPCSVEMDDLVQAGMIGLWEAADSYKPELNLGASFEHYARRRITGAMLDHLRNEDPVSRLDRRKIKLMTQARGQLQCEGRTPTMRAMADKMGISLAELSALQQLELASTSNSPCSPDDTIDNLHSEEGNPEAIFEQRAWLTRVQARVNSMPADYKMIFDGALEGRSWKSMAAALGVTEARVSQKLNLIVAFLSQDDHGCLWGSVPKAINSDIQKTPEPDLFYPTVTLPESSNQVESEIREYFESQPTSRWPTAVR